MKFDRDVFISYAHLDNKPLDEGAKGWITDFHTLLETRLGQTIGHEVLVWRDEKLTGNEVFAAEIESQLPSLKLMVSIITPRYLGSDWCRRELSAFYKAALQNGGISIGNKSRIFKIVKTPVDQKVIEQLPHEIHPVFDEILDYKFYIPEPATGKFRELSRYSWVEPTIKQEYMSKVEDVVFDMANLIRLFNSTGDIVEDKKKIYLAETSYDLQTFRDNLARELQEAGFTVLPNRNLPFVVNQFSTEVAACLDQSMLSLHLISPTNYALQPEGTDKSIVMLQNELAARKSETGALKRLIWIPPAPVGIAGNESLAARQAAFVAELQSNQALQAGADILMGPLEEFKLAIFDTIGRMKEEEDKRLKAEEDARIAALAAGSAPAAGSRPVRLVYLICDQRDLDQTRPLEDFFTDQGCEVMVPYFDDNNALSRQEHRENLKVCDAVVIYYGAGNYRWVNSLKSDLLRLPTMERTTPLLGKAIYLAGPPDPDKEKFRSNDFVIINGLDGFRPEQFDPFVQSLK